MDCKECKGCIHPFLKKELGDRKSRILLRHISECPSCKEDMRSEYLVIEGLRRLESGSDFNLRKDFERMLKAETEKNEAIHNTRLLVNMAVGFMLLLPFVVLIIGVIL